MKNIYPETNILPNTARWCTQLKYIVSELNSLSLDSETQFSQITDGLLLSNSSCKEITALAMGIVNQFSDKDYEHSIQNLEKIFGVVSEILSGVEAKFDKGETSLDEITAVLKNIYDEVAGLRSLDKHLRVHGISIKIESARLGADDKGFTNIAENIGNLSTSIAEKSRIFNDKVKLLFGINNSFKNHIVNLKLTSREHYTSIMKNESRSLQSLTEKYSSSSQKAQSVHNIIYEINKNISSLVTSVQFHDITRQQMSSVIYSITSLVEKVELEISRPGLHTDNQLRKIFNEVAKIQAAQLNHSREELFNAVSKIIESLSSINNSISFILTEVESLLENTGKNSSFIVEIKEGLKSIVSDLEGDSDIDNKLSDSLTKVISVIEELSGFINQISEIGSEIELISLNASIKAARVGKEGAALSVLASAIQRISSSSTSQISPIVNMLIQVAEASGTLKESIHSHSSGADGNLISSASDQINDNLQRLTVIVENAMEKLGLIRTETSSLQGTLSYITEYTTVHERTNDVINRILATLEKIIEESGGENNSSESDVDLDDFRQTYTMQKQREIHNAVTSSSLHVSKSYNHGTSDLGDNVELF